MNRRRGASLSSLAHHRRHHLSPPPARSAVGRMARQHSPSLPASFRHANSDFRPHASTSFRARFPPPPRRRGTAYVPSSSFRSRAPRLPSTHHHCLRSHFRGIVPSVSPPRRGGASSSFRAGGARRGAMRISLRGGGGRPPRIPYHCRTDISPRRSPCRTSRSRSVSSPLPHSAATPPPQGSSSLRRSSLSRSPAPMSPEMGRGGGGRGVRRGAPAFRGRGGASRRRSTTDRSKFIGNFGRPVNHPPAYEVSPDRTLPPPPVDDTAMIVAVAASGDDVNDGGNGPVVVPSSASAAAAAAAEQESNRDDLYTKMMEAKKSENLDEYYRLRDALNAFDVRNPHLAFRGSGAARRKRSRSAEMKKEVGAGGSEGEAARKRKRHGGGSTSGDDGHDEDNYGTDRHHRSNSHRHRHEERRGTTATTSATIKTTTTAHEKRTTKDKKKKHAEEVKQAYGGGATGDEISSTTMLMMSDAAATTADELEEVDSIGKQFDEDDEVGFVLVENEHLDHGGGGGDEAAAAMLQMMLLQSHVEDDADDHGTDEQQQAKQPPIATTAPISTKSSTIVIDDDDNVIEHVTSAAAVHPRRDDLWSSFAHLPVPEQLRLLRARIAELERVQQQEANGGGPQNSNIDNEGASVPTNAEASS